ncbi:thioredoxin-like protein [Dichotomopilus funicola]|uniref:Thioredoxin-like protein n=1 Tax=Dichotomopilus funicola TaxID=1934379 RepID=A0AAN6UUE9_9PEZI|nr:thioredoxin-like protein [Dichotomopilus funicola]
MFRSTLRPLTSVASATSRRAPVTRLSSAAAFHTTRPMFIKPGDPLPDTDALMEKTPGQRVNLAEEAERVNKMLLIGVPAAFSPACSATHVPGYAQHPKTKEMKAWGDALDPAGDQGIRFFADPTGQFTKALDLAFDGSAIFGGDRSKRYAIVVENGKVKSVAVEPDNTGTSVSLAENVLGSV